MAYPALTDNEVPSQASAPHILTPSPSRGSSPAPSFRRLDSVTWRQTLASNVNGSQVWDLSFPGVDGGGVQERGEAASANSSGMANRLSQLSRAETLVGNMEAGSPQGKGGEVALDSRTGSIGGSGHSRPGAGGRPALKFGSALWRRAGRLRRWLRWLLTRERFHLVIVALVLIDLLLVFFELVVALLTAGCTGEREYQLILNVVAASALGDGPPLRPSDFACVLLPSPSRDRLELGLFATNLAFLSTFTLEVMVALVAFGPIAYLKSPISLLDAIIVLATFSMDVAFHVTHSIAGHSAAAMVIMRLWKIVRCVHAIAHVLEIRHASVLQVKVAAIEALDRERIAEAFRLTLVRKAFLRETGHDIDPGKIEAEVQLELQAWDAAHHQARASRRFDVL